MTNELQDDVVIAVMGSTGTGKSSFIWLISGDPSVLFGHGLESETSEIQVVRFVDPKSRRRVVIVDTPGFDDFRRGDNDTDILKRIAKFLLEQYDEKRKLNGLVYLQRISDPRFSGQSDRNLRMFKGLCGSKHYKNVVVLTTFWDKMATKEEGVQREEQLKTRFFQDLVAGGAEFMRHNHGNMKTGRKVLEHIFTLSPANLQIQEEIREQGKRLEDTAAGSVHREEIERMIAKHKAEMASLQEELETLRANQAAERQEMKEELDKLRLQLARETQERDLRKGLDKAMESQAQLKLEVAEQKDLRNKTERDHRQRIWNMEKQLNEEKVARKATEEELQKRVRDEPEQETQEREKKVRDQEKRKRERKMNEEIEREARRKEEERRVQERAERERLDRELAAERNKSTEQNSWISSLWTLFSST